MRLAVIAILFTLLPASPIGAQNRRQAEVTDVGHNVGALERLEQDALLPVGSLAPLATRLSVVVVINGPLEPWLDRARRLIADRLPPWYNEPRNQVQRFLGQQFPEWTFVERPDASDPLQGADVMLSVRLTQVGTSSAGNHYLAEMAIYLREVERELQCNFYLERFVTSDVDEVLQRILTVAKEGAGCPR